MLLRGWGMEVVGRRAGWPTARAAGAGGGRRPTSC